MCSSAPGPEMWIIQGTLAWLTPLVRTGVRNQTSPQEDRWGDSGAMIYFTGEVSGSSPGRPSRIREKNRRSV
ncbi:unnamed protein product [Lactuca virosa]|uniref:Uncharacterized protein n=1 Tax=Lactuca virosa TaxID=75947 RepID=A0AAU9M723_9ASTR|nr:unnamed protein product [Lactuca virosa]